MDSVRIHSNLHSGAYTVGREDVMVLPALQGHADTVLDAYEACWSLWLEM